MNEKSSPSNRAPLKSYALSEDSPRGEWFLISHAKGSLYAYREGSSDIYISREVIAISAVEDPSGKGLEHLVFFEEDALPGIAKFLSGTYGFDTPSHMVFEDGHPCYGSLEGFPLGEWYTIAFTGGCISCYRFDDGVFLADGVWYPAGEDEGPPPAPLIHPEEYQEAVLFFAGSGGLDSLAEVGSDAEIEPIDEEEGGLAR
jgi:hypothetical protein